MTNGTTAPPDASFQPLAPQAPGNVLMGRFGKMANTANWKVWVGVLAVVLLGWYFWRKMR